MKLNAPGLLNKIAKIMAPPLSLIVANPLTERLSRTIEAYWCILLGKGAGTGWAMNAEISAARWAIRDVEPVILDVGANQGEWSARMQQNYGLAKIFMFEPQPACQKSILEKNIPGTVLIPCAVGATPDENLELFVSNADSGIASFHKRRDSYFADYEFDSIKVNIVTLDQFIEERKLSQVDFVKIDVEGHEFAVLRGAEKSMKSGTIKALSFEFGSGNLNSRTFFHDFWDLLTPLGYVIYRILPAGQLLPIKQYYEDCEYFRGVTNYIAVLQTGDQTGPEPAFKL